LFVGKYLLFLALSMRASHGHDDGDGAVISIMWVYVHMLECKWSLPESI